MDYFRILNLEREPFSNSPDPELFYQSRQHVGCLQQLELSLRLRRGLNVVLGEVGTGKTTLCRQLIRKLEDDSSIETHLVLDPHFSGPSEFLTVFAGMLLGRRPSGKATDFQVKESIKKRLLRKGIDEDKTVVLILDEGQKIPDFCLEILREFLNYETNDHKLLQIVIFAQTEFDKTLKAHPNFGDRISLYHFLEPLNFRDTRLMILHRINQSSSSPSALSFFSLPSLWAIYRATGGYPRKIVTLCHRSILAMIIQNRSRAGWMLVRSCVRRVFSEKIGPRHQARHNPLVIIFALLAIIAAYYGYSKIPTSAAPVAAPPPRQMKPNKAVMHPDIADAHESKMESDTPSALMTDEIPFAPPSSPVNPGEVPEDPRLTPPLTLGRITVQRRETLGGLAQKIYGRATPQYVDKIVSVNPHLSDPDNLSIGDIIELPALPISVRSSMEKHWWIRIAAKNTLADSLEVLRSYPDRKGPIQSTPLRLIPYWHHRKGLLVSVVFGGAHGDKATAQEELNRLPEFLAARGEIVSLGNEEAVYYADPFLAAETRENLVENTRQ